MALYHYILFCFYYNLALFNALAGSDYTYLARSQRHLQVDMYLSRLEKAEALPAGEVRAIYEASRRPGASPRLLYLYLIKSSAYDIIDSDINPESSAFQSWNYSGGLAVDRAFQSIGVRFPADVMLRSLTLRNAKAASRLRPGDLVYYGSTDGRNYEKLLVENEHIVPSTLGESIRIRIKPSRMTYLKIHSLPLSDSNSTFLNTTFRLVSVTDAELTSPSAP